MKAEPSWASSNILAFSDLSFFCSSTSSVFLLGYLDIYILLSSFANWCFLLGRHGLGLFIRVLRGIAWCICSGTKSIPVVPVADSLHPEGAGRFAPWPIRGSA